MSKPVLDVQRPAEVADTPTYRFWGKQQPPKDRKLLAVDDETKPSAAGTGTVATIRLYGPIDSWGGFWGVSAKEVSEALDALPADVEHIQLRINSPGGEAWEALAILNMLRAHKATVTAVVDGIAASAASFIASGCEETIMSPGTQLMIHDARTFVYGPPAVMRKVAGILDTLSNSVADLYTEAAGGTSAAWRELMSEETWYTAKETVTAGLADKVAVVPDAGATSTAGDDEPDDPIEDDEIDESIEDRFDLSIYKHAGRSHAPPPAAIAATHKPPTASAGGSTSKEGASLVDFTDEQIATLREQVGFPEDADAETITAALAEALEERADAPPATGPASVKVTVPDGMALVEKDVLDGLRTQAAEGSAARKQQLTEHRDRTIRQAISDGKITPARQEAWEKKWAADPEGAEQELKALEAGLVPVDEIGHEGDPNQTADDALYATVWGDDEKKGA